MCSRKSLSLSWEHLWMWICVWKLCVWCVWQVSIPQKFLSFFFFFNTVEWKSARSDSRKARNNETHRYFKPRERHDPWSWEHYVKMDIKHLRLEYRTRFCFEVDLDGKQVLRYYVKLKKNHKSCSFSGWKALRGSKSKVLTNSGTFSGVALTGG